MGAVAQEAGICGRARRLLGVLEVLVWLLGLRSKGSEDPFSAVGGEGRGRRQDS